MRNPVGWLIVGFFSIAALMLAARLTGNQYQTKVCADRWSYPTQFTTDTGCLVIIDGKRYPESNVIVMPGE